MYSCRLLGGGEFTGIIGGWPKSSFGFFLTILWNTRTNFLANPIHSCLEQELLYDVLKQFFLHFQMNSRYLRASSKQYLAGLI